MKFIVAYRVSGIHPEADRIQIEATLKGPLETALLAANAQLDAEGTGLKLTVLRTEVQS